MATMRSSNQNILRLLGVAGFGDKKNDVVVSGLSHTQVKKRVLFFGGDVQDFEENMDSNEFSKQYVKWNLEAVARLMQSKFESAHVYVIRPTSMVLNTFSDYSNFVVCNENTNPIHDERHGSWRHLMHLIKNVTSLVGKSGEVVSSGETTEDVPISIIGFSKGCIVLNQFLYELAQAQTDPDLATFVSHVKDMYWLDGGHNGGSNTWIVHDRHLQSLAQSGIQVHVHVTPYQMNDPARIWVGKESKKFVQRLRGLGVDVKFETHFKDEDRSIERHFEILNVFL